MAASPKVSEVIALPRQPRHHSHDYKQVVIGLQGQTEFDVGGRGSLIGPGQGCLVAESQEHAFTGVGRNEILVINLPSQEWSEQALMHENIARLFAREPYFQLDTHAQILVKALSAEMVANPSDPLLSRACADTLMCVLHRHFRDHVSPRRDGHRLNMDIIDRYIHQHISRKITVAQLAGSVFLAESQFHQLFKQQVGTTPHQYVLDKRFALAKQFIKDSDLTMAQIADSCGFSSQSGFTNAFSRYFGLSPARFKCTP
ncbi:AraC family transcriptional regulator [Salinivibrio costicola]|uniref:AraC family transcriptional regulator n=1 Tax=Salinivibrio costicola TaxID=51367 RepID=UPI003F6E9616